MLSADWHVLLGRQLIRDSGLISVGSRRSTCLDITGRDSVRSGVAVVSGSGSRIGGIRMVTAAGECSRQRPSAAMDRRSSTLVHPHLKMSQQYRSALAPAFKHTRCVKMACFWLPIDWSLIYGLLGDILSRCSRDSDRSGRALEAGSPTRRQQQAALQQLRSMASTMPARTGWCRSAGFSVSQLSPSTDNIDLADFPEIRDPVLLGLALGGNFVAVETTLVLKSRESAVWEEQVELLKEVVDREYRGRSRGVSVPVGMGVRYRVGQSRGHLVTVGQHWETADTGMLTVTDQRVVYHGVRRTIEFPYKKLATLQAFIDAVSLGVTSRQTTSTFRTRAAELIAGLIHAAADSSERGLAVVALMSSSLVHYLVVISIVSTLMLGVIPSVVCWLKGKRRWAIIGFFSAWHIIAAFRLAKPESWWARTFYGEAKLAAARTRFAIRDAPRSGASESVVAGGRPGAGS